jgi:hypothetical protein
VRVLRASRRAAHEVERLGPRQRLVDEDLDVGLQRRGGEDGPGEAGAERRREVRVRGDAEGVGGRRRVERDRRVDDLDVRDDDAALRERAVERERDGRLERERAGATSVPPSGMITVTSRGPGAAPGSTMKSTDMTFDVAAETLVTRTSAPRSTVTSFAQSVE